MDQQWGGGQCPMLGSESKKWDTRARARSAAKT
jgi:hypothetical protein